MAEKLATLDPAAVVPPSADSVHILLRQALRGDDRVALLGYLYNRDKASELQTSMIETMEATEIEKQRHHNTRMEALVRLAELEITNAELAKSLAMEQWNLEVQCKITMEMTFC